MTQEESEFLRHIACPACGSSDANALYSDGHTYCHKCGTHAHGDAAPPTRPRNKMTDFLQGDVRDLPRRGLSAAACAKFGYRVAEDRKGKPCQVADYRDQSGALVAQKVRYADKSFVMLGDGRAAPLFGQHLWAGGGKRLVITEGEIDAITVGQATGLSWPVVSIPNGSDGAARSIRKNIEFVLSFETVVLCFDNDEPGRKAAAEVAAILPPGKAFIAELPRKDANEMWVAGESKALNNALWQARPYRPDGIVSLDDIRGKVLETTELGAPWPWETLTKATFGRRPGEVYALGAGTGVGKTDVFTQIIANDVMNLDVTCGVLYLEQPVVETARRVAGKIAGKRFHVPDGSWGMEELSEAFERLAETGKLHLYDAFGAMEWEVIEPKIIFMIVGLGCKHIFLDHLTALAAGADDERVALEGIMAKIAGLAQRYGVVFHFISHLATPEGKPHEEGGRVTIRHFKGSRAIGFWSHFMFGLERDQQAKDPAARHQTTFRVLKDRYTGQATGLTFGLGYDAATGLLTELDGTEAFDDGGTSEF